MVVQDQIDEVSPEQEEAESQENIHTAPNFYGQAKTNKIVANEEPEDDEA